jgi:hypothetical protein
MDRVAITHEINRVLGENIINYSTVGKYVRMFVLSTKERDTHIVPESEGDFSFDDRITLVLSEEPFLSVDQVAEKRMMSKSTMYRHLTQTMRWALRHVKCVPHSRTESEQMNRVQGQQNFWSFYSQSGTKGGDMLSPLTSRIFIGRSIRSSRGFQRMMNRE